MGGVKGSPVLVVGIDLGTTETKAVLTTLDGATVGCARRATTWTRTSAGRLESTGATLTNDALATVRDALVGHASRTGQRATVAGVGITGLAESGVVLDGRGRETSPVIAWFDDRGADELRAADPHLVASFPARTGLAVGPQWTLAKLLWLRAAGLELGGACRWLNMPEFIAWSLTGQQVSEPSLASRTGLMDQASAEPWDEALAAIGATRQFVPEPALAGTVAGRVERCPEVPELDGAVVTVAGHDHPVAAVGAGASGPQDIFSSCGTAEVLLRSVPRVLDDDERTRLVDLGIDAGRHILPGHSALIAGMRSGLVMRRVLGLVDADDPGRRDELDRRWQPAGARPASVRVSGASAHDDDVSIHLGDGATPDAAWAATLEHLALQTQALLAGISGVVGEHRSAVAAGGWTRLRSVRESKARVLPRLRFCPVDQPGARGAALFAACAAGEGGVDELSRRFARTAQNEADSQNDRSQKEHAP